MMEKNRHSSWRFASIYTRLTFKFNLRFTSLSVIIAKNIFQFYLSYSSQSPIGSTGSFKINFQVYKSHLYNHSYGVEEFPIYLGLSNRIYFELSMDQPDLTLIPHECYATQERSYLSGPRYHLIEERSVLYSGGSI